MTLATALVTLPYGWEPLVSIVRVSVVVSGVAVFVSTLVGVPIAIGIGTREFPGRHLLASLITTGMGLPSVIVGLVVLFAVSRQGPFGEWDLVFTTQAMMISQFVLALPVITGVSLAAIDAIEEGVRDAAFVLGGTRLDVALVTVSEARYGIATAILAGFGRAISEVGSVLIVGGNIAYADGTSKTRTLTTAIQLEARQGQFEGALVLGAVLLGIVLLVNLVAIRLGRGIGGYR